MKILAKSDDRQGSFNAGTGYLRRKVESAGLRTTVYTAFALIAFAANSVLCRLALGQGDLDAASFTTIRLVSGAAVLLLVCAGGKTERAADRGNWTSAFMLFLYAVTFSFAYISLNTGTGALILFAAVQATMIIFAIYKGERLGLMGSLGLFVALTGLTYLVFPGLDAPSPLGAILMTLAGVSWGIYSLRGRGLVSPVAVTRDNFLRSTPFVLLISPIFLQGRHLTPEGAFFAALSGALTSAIGYVVWYAALRDISATRAAIVQLLVPVLAALGGVAILTEPITVRLLLSSAMIIGGVALALTQRGNAVRAKSAE